MLHRTQDSRDRGVSIVEYGVGIALIAVIALAALGYARDAIVGVLDDGEGDLAVQTEGGVSPPPTTASTSTTVPSSSTTTASTSSTTSTTAPTTTTTAAPTTTTTAPPSTTTTAPPTTTTTTPTADPSDPPWGAAPFQVTQGPTTIGGTASSGCYFGSYFCYTESSANFYIPSAAGRTVTIEVVLPDGSIVTHETELNDDGTLDEPVEQFVWGADREITYRVVDIEAPAPDGWDDPAPPELVVG